MRKDRAVNFIVHIAIRCQIIRDSCARGPVPVISVPGDLSPWYTICVPGDLSLWYNNPGRIDQMRLADAVKSLQIGRERDKDRRELCTVWSELSVDGPDAVPLPEYPRPQLVRKKWICLNGWWEYAILPSGEAFHKPDGKILVPFSPETARSGVKRMLLPGETLWYRRLLPDPDLKKGERLLLHFGAVDERCAVYWNGHCVGRHRNGYLPFSFDVTEFVRKDRNILTVCVRDDTDRGTACRGKQTLHPGGMYYHAQSGIWQTVWLEPVPEMYLEDLKITPDPENSRVRVEMNWTGIPAQNDAGSRENHGDPAHTEGESGLSVRINLEGMDYTFPAERQMDVSLPVSCPRLWSPENPNLYPLRIQAEKDDLESYFAMRSFGTGKDPEGRPCLMLNGKPYFFHGVLDQGYWPESLMTPPADEAMIFDISGMKRLSFNTIRKHIKIEPARWYYHCDRLGMVVWQDMVNGGGPVNKLLQTWIPTAAPAVWTRVKDSRYRLFSREDSAARKWFEEDLLRMIRCLYNVPSIGMWVLFNEGWGQFDSLRLCDLVRDADPARVIDHASGWYDQGGGDICSIHNYFRKLQVIADARACVLSEYGGYACAVEDHTMTDAVYGYRTFSREEYPSALKALMDEIHSLAGKGLSGAVYTQVSDIEEEINGLFTYDRKVCKV